MTTTNASYRQLITLRVACVCSHAGDPPSGGSGVGRPGGGRSVGKESRRYARGQALPPMVAVLKLWGPNEATAALLTEGAELRLHRLGRRATVCLVPSPLWRPLLVTEVGRFLYFCWRI